MVVDLKEYRSIMAQKKLNSDYSLAGGQGCCFVQDNKIVKVYNSPINSGNISDLRQYKSNRISFPLEYIYENGKIAGEVMPYYPYDTLDIGLNLESRLDKFIVHYNDIIREINRFPDLFMFDIDIYENILYDDNAGMYLIDVLRWYKQIGSNFVNVNNLNRTIMNMFRSLIYGEQSFISMILYDFDINYRILHNTLLGQEFLELIKINLSCDSFIKELIDAYKRVVKGLYNEDINTFGDIKKYTKIMKNS